MPPSLLVSPRARGCTVRRFPERLAVGGSSPLARGIGFNLDIVESPDGESPF